MSDQYSSITALSAPGKVLLTGGYLVLDRDYTGTVFALDARIHAIVQQMRRPRPRTASGPKTDAQLVNNGLQNLNRPLGPAVEDQEYEDTIIVQSPQFVDAVWEYRIQAHENDGGISVVQKSNG